MRTLNFPGCCTAKVITGFGQTETAEYTFRPETKLSRYQMAVSLYNVIISQRRQGSAIITITTNSQQVDANAVLKAMGFEHSKWTSKLAHPETKLRVWFFSLDRIADDKDSIFAAVNSFK